MDVQHLLNEIKEFQKKENFKGEDSEQMRIFSGKMCDIEDLDFSAKQSAVKMRDRYFSHSDHMQFQDHYMYNPMPI